MIIVETHLSGDVVSTFVFPLAESITYFDSSAVCNVCINWDKQYKLPEQPGNEAIMVSKNW